MAFEVQRLERPLNEIERLKSFYLFDKNIDERDFFMRDPQLEEEMVKNHVILSGTHAFDQYRKMVRSGLKAIVRSTWDIHKIRSQHGVDVGSGPLGEMASKLIPPRARKNCIQVELNHSSVQSNQHLHPYATIIEGSYLELSKIIGEKADFVTGLSCLDSTMQLDLAIDEISATLRSGGYLVHVQDMGPGEPIVCDEMMRRHEVSPYKGKAISQGLFPRFMITDNGRGQISTVDLFRERIGRVIEKKKKDVELIENGWVTALDSNVGPYYNLHHLHGLYDPNPPHNNVEISAVVTVARNK